MVNLIDKIHAKLELFRLEQRYTRRRNRRSTFVSEAQYIDGEYVYNVPSKWSGSSSGGSSESRNGSGRGDDSIREESHSTETTATGPASAPQQTETERKRSRLSRISIREMKWDGGIRS